MKFKSELITATAKVLEEGLGGGGGPKIMKLVKSVYDLDEVEQGTFIRALRKTLGPAKFDKLLGGRPSADD
jgi:hypothetical protein